MDDSLSLAASDAEELSGSYHDPALLHSAQPSASSPGMDADLLRILSNAVEELSLEWSPPEEPSRRRLEECFLPGRRQAPRQRASPFFPEVHKLITKSWPAPYLSRLCASSSSALTSVDGAKDERIRQPASPGVSGRTSLPAHGYWLEGKSRPMADPWPV